MTPSYRQNKDAIEVDGARFRGNDEVRELVYKAHLAPLRDFPH